MAADLSWPPYEVRVAVIPFVVLTLNLRPQALLPLLDGAFGDQQAKEYMSAQYGWAKKAVRKW